MSFGPVASTGRVPGFPRVEGGQSCPCGSGSTFAECCRPLHRGAAAPTPERLMRSRYSAFVVGDAAYLSQTWHPRSRPETLELDPAQRRTRLEIVDAVEQGDRGTVRFRAHWRHGDDQGVLAETSLFRRLAARWYYLEGDVS